MEPARTKRSATASAAWRCDPNPALSRNSALLVPESMIDRKKEIIIPAGAAERPWGRRGAVEATHWRPGPSLVLHESCRRGASRRTVSDRKFDSKPTHSQT